jgi:hypothetical protein
MPPESMDFTLDGQDLRGFFARGEGNQESCVILLHPHPLYGGGLNDRVVLELESSLMERGIGSFRFGFRGSHTTPDGYYGVSGAVEDTLAAARFLSSSHEVSTPVYVGYSFGGAAALRAAARKEPAGLVTLSASVDLVQEGGYPLSSLGRIDCECLMFHGTDDMMIPSSDVELLSAAVGSNTMTILVDGEGHFYRQSLKEVGKQIADFVERVI